MTDEKKKNNISRLNLTSVNGWDPQLPATREAVAAERQGVYGNSANPWAQEKYTGYLCVTWNTGTEGMRKETSWLLKWLHAEMP